MAFWGNLLSSACCLLISSQDETFFDVSFALGSERGRTKQSVQPFPPPIRVRVLSHLTSVKRDELGYQIQVSSDIQVFLSQTSCSKTVCSFYSAAECIHLSMSLFI